MAKYAHFDHTAPAPQPIRGWYDTDLIDYGDKLPPAADLLALSDSQWAARMPEPSGWTHSDGILARGIAKAKPGLTTVSIPKSPVG